MSEFRCVEQSIICSLASYGRSEANKQTEVKRGGRLREQRIDRPEFSFERAWIKKRKGRSDEVARGDSK